MTIQQRVVALCGALDDACVIAEYRAEEDVRVREEALLSETTMSGTACRCAACARDGVSRLSRRGYTPVRA